LIQATSGNWGGLGRRANRSGCAAYLATVIDCYSRRIVGFAIANHLRTDLITDALRMAVIHRTRRPG
jgi:transposase InsO family protein